MYYRSDNPIRDAFMRDMDEEDEPCKECVECGEKMFDGDWGYFIDDEWYCPDCVMAVFGKRVTV